jgi:putative lipoprotein (rSAM/lipoprotein system)
MIEGKVLDEATGEPIEGIKIRSNGYSSGQDMTDVEGRFHFWHGSQPPTTITLTVEDIDGPENGGEWASQSRQTEISKKNFAPGSNGHEWEGHWEVDFALKLKPQEDENE